MNKSDLAREYREKYGWEMPTLKLARIMYADNNLLFSNLEAARICLRYIEGKHGAKTRTFKTIIQMPERPKNPYKLPDSDETDFTPYEIKGHKRVAILSDIHVPYHNIAIIRTATTLCF